MWITLEEAKQAMRVGVGEGIRIAIIDSGVETSHPDLQGLKLTDDIMIVRDGPRLHAVDGRGVDLYGHGTAIASIIHRIAPKAEIGSFQALNQNLGAKSDAIELAVSEALRRGYQILNCSFGCRGEDRFLRRYKDWIDKTYLRGAHIVAACNNDDMGEPEWPAYFSSVIAVNMARIADDETIHHCPGRLVEFAARGTELDLPWRDGKRKTGVSGSSYAAPVVAALVARLLGAYHSLSPLATKAVLAEIALPWDPNVAAENFHSNSADFVG